MKLFVLLGDKKFSQPLLIESQKIFLKMSGSPTLTYGGLLNISHKCYDVITVTVILLVVIKLCRVWQLLLVTSLNTFVAL